VALIIVTNASVLFGIIVIHYKRETRQPSKPISTLTNFCILAIRDLVDIEEVERVCFCGFALTLFFRILRLSNFKIMIEICYNFLLNKWQLNWKFCVLTKRSISECRKKRIKNPGFPFNKQICWEKIGFFTPFLWILKRTREKPGLEGFLPAFFAEFAAI
jgi:hypothetical protein